MGIPSEVNQSEGTVANAPIGVRARIPPRIAEVGRLTLAIGNALAQFVQRSVALFPALVPKRPLVHAQLKAQVSAFGLALGACLAGGNDSQGRGGGEQKAG